MPQRRYDRQHRRIRAKYAAVVAAGEAVCARCHKPISPFEPWDLDHDDEHPGRNLGPSHRACNRAEPFRRLHRLANEAVAQAATDEDVHDCREEFDPQRCAECRRRGPTPTNSTSRWSRHWDSGRFNPRCRDCRERGSMCDFALKWAREDGGPEAA
jgi:hypothetical protein